MHSTQPSVPNPLHRFQAYVLGNPFYGHLFCSSIFTGRQEKIFFSRPTQGKKSMHIKNNLGNVLKFHVVVIGPPTTTDIQPLFHEHLEIVFLLISQKVEMSFE